MSDGGVMTLEQAVVWRAQLRKAGKKLVVTNGCFDLMHCGHASYLAQARAGGDALLVLVNSDASVRALKGPKRPIVPEHERAVMLCALKAVDAAVIFDSPRCCRELASLAPDLYVKAGDYTLESLDPSERNALTESGSKIVFMPFVAGFSTTNIIEKILASGK